MPTLFDTKFPNNSRVVSGVATIYRDDVILLCDTSAAPVTINLFDIPNGFWSTQWKLYIVDNNSNASVNNIIINAGAGQLINGQASLTLNTNDSAALVQIISDTNFIGNRTFIAGGGSVTSVTGLNTDNTDPANPIVQISVDGVTVTGSGTPADPLVSVGGGTGYDTIKDEGVALTQRSTIDFIGEFVSAADDGAETEVNINPTTKQILNADLNTEITNGTLIKGLEYEVTDAPYVESITLLAIANNRVEVEGKALKYVADYQAVGDYSGVVGFNAQLGRWNGALTPVAGDVVIWNNNHYLNISGANNPASTPDVDAANWSLLIVSLTTGFILEPMVAEYNPTNNKVLKLKDLRLNEVDFADPKGIISFLGFPFGDNNVKNNIFKGTDLTIESFFANVPFTEFRDNECINAFYDFNINFGVAICSISAINNRISGGAQLELFNSSLDGCTGVTYRNNLMTGGNVGVSGILTAFTGQVIVESNTCTQGSFLVVQTGTIQGAQDLVISQNQVDDTSQVTIVDINTNGGTAIEIKGNRIISTTLDISGLETDADFRNNYFNSRENIVLPTITNNDLFGLDGILTEDFSNLKKTLDISNALILDPITNTLDLGTEDFYGEYLLQNGTGNIIAKITQGNPLPRPFTLTADSGAGVLTFRITPAAIGAAVQDEIIANTSHNLKTTFTSYATRSERVTLRRGGGVTGFLFMQEQENWT